MDEEHAKNLTLSAINKQYDTFLSLISIVKRNLDIAHYTFLSTLRVILLINPHR
jgi:hypothetical protein